MPYPGFPLTKFYMYMYTKILNQRRAIYLSRYVHDRMEAFYTHCTAVNSFTPNLNLWNTDLKSIGSILKSWAFTGVILASIRWTVFSLEPGNQIVYTICFDLDHWWPLTFRPQNQKGPSFSHDLSLEQIWLPYIEWYSL